ncbi:MAG: zinc/manganese transporter permease [Thiotrichales bacterium SG8_50]|nr:MAG: zinc/manganese transporter permease [Thiotrichales bacterium SG8_50]
MNWDALDFSIVGPAFAAGLLILATHVPLGRQVLRRGIIFIDLAIAQVAGLGVIAANALDWEPHGWGVQLVATAAALAGALALYLTERLWPDVQEALIGVLFILAATGGILLLSHNPHGGEHLRELLVGQILWTSYGQLFAVAWVYAGVGITWVALRRQSSSLLFYIIFAVTVTVSVQLGGVFLVFASLIIPALAVRRLEQHGLAWAYGVGIAGYAFGLLASALFDLPAGALIVWSLALVGIVVGAVVGRRRTGQLGAG